MSKPTSLRTTQDDARENQQIAKFGLASREGRSNKYTPDADLLCEGAQYVVELKTSDVAKKQVSTARGVTLDKIKEWRKVQVWIFSQYERPNRLTGENYVLFPEEMEAYYKKLEDKIRKGTKKLAGLDDWNSAKSILVAAGIDNAALNKLDYAFNHKGCALNDPKIPWSYVETNGTRVSSAAELREIVKEYYSPQGFTNREQCL